MDIKKRLERIITIFFLLQSKSVVSIKELEQRFGIGRRTAYRDLKVLEQAGVPLFNDSGQGFSVMEGFKMQPSRFTQEEVLSLMIAEKVMKNHETEFVKRHFETALIRIKSSFRSQQKTHISDLEDRLHMSEPFRANEYLPNVIDVLLKSILNKKNVRVDYLNSGTDKAADRRIEPVGLFYENNCWYAIAYCLLRADYRNFRLDRIKKIDETNSSFSREHPSIEELRKEDLQEPRTSITIMVDNKYAHFLFWERENYGFIREENDADMVIMYFDCRQHPTAFARWFMRFVDIARIIEPVFLSNEVKEILKNGLENMKTK